MGLSSPTMSDSIFSIAEVSIRTSILPSEDIMNYSHLANIGMHLDIKETNKKIIRLR